MQQRLAPLMTLFFFFDRTLMSPWQHPVVSIRLLQLDIAKRTGWVGSIGSQVKTGYGSKRVIFKRVNRVAGQTGRGLSRVELTHIFQNFFFFLKYMQSVNYL